MPRWTYFLGGLALLAAGAHVTITRTVGYGDTQSLLILALACGVALGSLGIGEALDHGRRGLALVLIVALAGGEAYGLLTTAERYVTSRDAVQAPIHDAEAKHAAALVRVAKAESSDAVVNAEAAKVKIDADAMVASVEKTCRDNCRLVLEGQMRTAEAAVVAAKTAIQREIEAARAELAQSPIPPSASPLADRLGVPAWVLDLIIAALASIACNGLAMGLLALGGHRPRPSSGAIALAPIEPPACNVVKLAPPMAKVGDVDAFMLERVAHERGARVAWADAFLAYRAWCGDYSVAAVDARAFGARLDALRAELGLKAITKGQDVFFVDLKLAS